MSRFVFALAALLAALCGLSWSPDPAEYLVVDAFAQDITQSILKLIAAAAGLRLTWMILRDGIHKKIAQRLMMLR
jgi:hypothetical protein